MSDDDSGDDALPSNVHLTLLDAKDLQEEPKEENKIKAITSAGILPVAVFKKRVYFLLGKEGLVPKFGDSDRWSDFSGKIEDGETIEQGASREFYEETAGCLMMQSEARYKLDHGEYILHSDLHPHKSTSFRTYLMLVPYKDYPLIFRRTKSFIQYPEVHGDVSVIEKSQLQWFSFEDMRDVIFDQWDVSRYKRKPKFRARFAENVRRIMKCIDLRQHCLDAYAASSNSNLTIRPTVINNRRHYNNG